MSKRSIWIAILAGVALAACLPFLRLDVDVFNLLPSDSPMVEGLRVYQRSFGTSSELILSLRAQDAQSAERAAASLAGALQSSELTPRVIWRSPFREEPDAMAELLAHIWYNRPPGEFEGLLDRFAGDRLQATLAGTLERMATSLRPVEVARLAHDPFALTDITERLPGSFADQARDPFASPDGRLRILFVRTPFEEGGFWEHRAWVGRVSAFLERWRVDSGFDDEVVLGVTGDPAFIAEVGSGLLQDVLLAAVGTLVIVAGLFWIAHRRLLPLLWLVGLLVLVLVATAVSGGLLLGALNAVSLGFAAILLGLAADYGLILYQEAAACPERTVRQHRRALAPSILWAAATTAGAFLMIGRSSLPGLTQLGVLVAIGIALAAVVMLRLFLPPIVALVQARPAPPDRPRSGRGLGPGWAWAATAVAAVVSVAVLSVRLPELDSGTEKLGPRDSQAQAALDEIQTEIGGRHDPLWLMVSGADETEVGRRLDRAEAIFDGAVAQGVLSGHALPGALWPRPEAQRANRPVARRLGERLAGARAAAVQIGFTPDALILTEAVFAAWTRYSEAAGVVWPDHPAARWVFRQFAARDEGGFLALGKLDAADDVTNAELLVLAERLAGADGGELFGWSLLSESLLEAMTRDVKQVLIPMGLVLLVILGLAFRSPREIALSLATLVFSTVCLLAVMGVAGWSWNLMNVMALPLLFGAGVDYSIHIQLALRRHGGDVGQVRRIVGRAILLCGSSTAAGFGTLAFASNAGLASLGRVCAVGILLAGFTSVFLLPAWWSTLRVRASGAPVPWQEGAR